VNHHNDIVAELLKRFESENEQSFVKFFNTYLEHEAGSFVVNLDDVWEWWGFAKKANAKTHMMKYCSDNIDYIVKILLPQPQQQVSHGGHNKETIMLTVDAFKSICMTANTDRGKQTRKYYLAMEKAFYDIVRIKQDKAAALAAKQAEEAAARAEELGRINARSETLISSNRNVILLYLGRIDEDMYKIGWTKDIGTRALAHKQEYGSSFVITDVWPIAEAQALEQYVLHHPEIQVRRRVNGNLTEIVQLDETFDAKQIRKIVARYLRQMEILANHDTMAAVIEKQRIELIREMVEKGIDPKVYDLQTPSGQPQGSRGGLSHGRIVLMYKVPEDGSAPTIVKTFEGARDASRDFRGVQDYDIRAATENNTMLQGYRWQMIDRALYSDNVPPLPPTVAPRHADNKVMRIAQLDKDDRRILAVHRHQKEAAASARLKAGGTISLAISRDAPYGGFRWAFYDSLSDEVKAAFEGHVPDATVARSSNKEVSQIDSRTNEVVRSFPCMSAAAKYVQGCHKSIHKAIRENAVYRGTLWKFE
jgi:phage anti-repressor protein